METLIAIFNLYKHPIMAGGLFLSILAIIVAKRKK